MATREFPAQFTCRFATANGEIQEIVIEDFLKSVEGLEVTETRRFDADDLGAGITGMVDGLYTALINKLDVDHPPPPDPTP